MGVDGYRSVLFGMRGRWTAGCGAGFGTGAGLTMRLRPRAGSHPALERHSNEDGLTGYGGVSGGWFLSCHLAPADVPKSGSAFDLPVALCLMAAGEALDPQALAGTCVVGELGLDGTVRPVRGVLSIAARCREDGIATLLCPVANAAEACVVGDLEVLPVATLRDACNHFAGRARLHPPAREARRISFAAGRLTELDFADVKGQETAKRALEIAAAGFHNALLVGPPGSGKSMLARRVAGIMPPLTHAEAVEVTKVHSVAGSLRAGQALVTSRPFRAPHHTVSDGGLVGGGSPPRPGEASLAHHGVLFLDELPEFRRTALESLRQPLEDGLLVLSRAKLTLTYPARFMLVAAMNPCPCGYYGTGQARCVCRPAQIERYTQRVSGPLLDRIDLHIDVPSLDGEQLTDERRGEPTRIIRDRVYSARERQTRRFAGTDCGCNGDMGPGELRAHCGIEGAGERLLRDAVRRLGLSARAYHRVLRVARTIADLDGTDRIVPDHLSEAVHYRSLDRKRTRI